MDILIANVTVVTMNPRMEVLFGGYLGVAEGKITYIGKKPPQEQPATIVDGTGMVAMPGLVNCHTHLTTTALRSYLDDVSRQEALEQLLQKESKLDSRCAKASALLGIAECLRFGVTSVSDLSGQPDAVAEAVAESGIKGNIALAASRFIDHSEDFDFEADEQCKELCRVVDKWHGYEDGRMKIDAGIYAEYTGNHQLWEAVSDYALEKGLGMQLHLAETREEVDSCLDRTGLGPAELLNCHRLFGVPAAAAGCTYLEETERELLGQKKATAVALPLAAAKVGLEATPIADCVKAGMNVALGTDGALQSGNQDMFEVMRAAAMQARTKGGEPTAMPASAVLMMATTCGARAQGRADETGILAEGMDADIILVDFSAPHLIPCHNVLSSLVFAAKGGDVAMTMVRGKILYQNGCFPTIDLKAVVEEITGYAIPRLFGENEE